MSAKRTPDHYYKSVVIATAPDPLQTSTSSFLMCTILLYNCVAIPPFCPLFPSLSFSLAYELTEERPGVLQNLRRHSSLETVWTLEYLLVRLRHGAQVFHSCCGLGCEQKRKKKKKNDRQENTARFRNGTMRRGWF